MMRDISTNFIQSEQMEASQQKDLLHQEESDHSSRNVEKSPRLASSLKLKH